MPVYVEIVNKILSIGVIILQGLILFIALIIFALYKVNENDPMKSGAIFIFISWVSSISVSYSAEVLTSIEPAPFKFEFSKNPDMVTAEGTWLGCDEPLNTTLITADRKKKKISVSTSWVTVRYSQPKKLLRLDHQDFVIETWTDETIVSRWTGHAKFSIQIVIDLKRKTVEQRSNGVAPPYVWRLGDGTEQFKTFFSGSVSE